MSAALKEKFQLWCYYEESRAWKMEGFFDTVDQAYKHVEGLQERLQKEERSDRPGDVRLVRVMVTDY